MSEPFRPFRSAADWIRNGLRDARGMLVKPPQEKPRPRIYLIDREGVAYPPEREVKLQAKARK